MIVSNINFLFEALFKEKYILVLTVVHVVQGTFLARMYYVRQELQSISV